MQHDMAFTGSMFINLQQIKGAEESGRKAKVADFGHQVEDPQFLNALQSGVNRWIREIQKVGYNCHSCVR